MNVAHHLAMARGPDDRDGQWSGGVHGQVLSVKIGTSKIFLDIVAALIGLGLLNLVMGVLRC